MLFYLLQLTIYLHTNIYLRIIHSKVRLVSILGIVFQDSQILNISYKSINRSKDSIQKNYNDLENYMTLDSL